MRRVEPITALSNNDKQEIANLLRWKRKYKKQLKESQEKFQKVLDKELNK